MNSAGCLKWCMEVRNNFPNDWRTAGHCIDWIADSARKEAETSDERAAIDECLRAAVAIRNPAPVTRDLFDMEAA